MANDKPLGMNMFGKTLSHLLRCSHKFFGNRQGRRRSRSRQRRVEDMERYIVFGIFDFQALCQCLQRAFCGSIRRDVCKSSDSNTRTRKNDPAVLLFDHVRQDAFCQAQRTKIIYFKHISVCMQVGVHFCIKGAFTGVVNCNIYVSLLTRCLSVLD